MADLQYTVDVSTTKGVNNVKNLEKQVSGLNTTFLRLKQSIATISLGAIATSTLNFARSIQQVSNATGIAVTTVNDFSNAVGQLGGNADKAVGDVIDFVAGLNDAKDGSASAQVQLQKVGITLEDLGRLSEEDLFKKTISGLAQIEDAAVRNSLAVKLLGKNFKDIDVRQVAKGMGTGGGANAGAITAAAEAQKSLSANLNNFTSALINVARPLTEVVSKIKISVDAFESLIKVIAYAAAAYLAYTKAVGLVNSGMQLLFKLLSSKASIFTMIASSVTSAYASFMRLFTGVGKVTAAAGGAITVWTRLQQVLFTLAAVFANIAKGLLRVGALVGIVMALAEAFDFLWKQITGYSVIDIAIDKVKKLYEAAKQYMGLGDESVKGYQAQVRAIDNMKESQDAINGVTQKVIDANRGARLEAEKTVRAYQQQNSELLSQMQFQNKLIGMNESDSNREAKMFEVQLQYVSQVNALKQKYVDMQAQAAIGTDEEKNAFKAFASVMDETVAGLSAEYNLQRTSVSKLINEEQVLLAKEKDRQLVLDNITQQMERQASLGDQVRMAYDKLKDTQFEGSQITRTPMEQQMALIQENARKAAREASLSFAAGFEGMDLSVEQAKELANGLEKIAEAYGKIAEAQMNNLKLDKTIGEGFRSITDNMNSAIDNFVETGKLKFGDFAKSVIQDLIKIELKAQASKLLSSMGGGITGFLGSLFGGFFANGGSPPVGKASIVGENGPELFIPKTAGTVIPNGAGTGQVINNYITNNNVSAIDARSVAQFFAENRKTMLGTVELARKEMPYSNR